MSFSAEVKTELCRAKVAKLCCARAEACGVLLFCNHFSPHEIKIVTESEALSSRAPSLFRRAFSAKLERKSEPGGKHVLSLHEPEALARIWELCGDLGGGIAHHINFALLEEEHCRLSFLRGAFLAGGSVNDPKKSYHLELVSSHYHVSRELHALLLDMGHAPKDSTRKSNYITYFKQSEQIEQLLTTLGAPIAAMAVMTAKVEKTLRGGVNRRVNCDAANVGKTVDAAQEQLRAIRLLERSGALERLGEKLREVALLRRENPELSLRELAELCDPPLSKSCLNHRLRKIMEHAEQA